MGSFWDFSRILPREVLEFHNKDDVDSSHVAHHHTLGKGSNQAAPGDHKHKISETVTRGTWVPSYTNSAGAAASVQHIYADYRVVDDIVFISCKFKMTATIAGDHVYLTMPFAPKADRAAVGSGREDWSTGKSLAISTRFTAGAWRFLVTFYDGGLSSVNGYDHNINGMYLKAD